MKSYLFLIVGIILLATGCGKTSTDCFTDPGHIASEFRIFDSAFNSLSMHENVNVELVHSNIPKVEVFAGENILSDITTEIIDHVLYIRNKSRCSFMYQSDRVQKVVVYYSRMDSIKYRSVGNLTTLGKVYTPLFKIDVFDGSGDINIKLDCNTSFINYHFGTADLRVEGQSGVNYIYQSSYGPIRAQELNTVFTYLENRSPNHCYVQADSVLEATINGRGNVYYKGNPLSKLLKGSGPGKLLPL